jgi:hypothetical protein
MLLVSAAEAICKHVCVRATKGIEKCFVDTKDNRYNFVIAFLSFI